jgi:hypothetical protein
VTLLGLLGRALTVALLFAVLLLPAADHHVATHLPGAIDLGVHHQLMHHHGAKAGEHPDVAPLLLPLGVAGVGVAVPSPFADASVAVGPPLLVGPALFERAPGVPSSLLEPPPLPPPVLPA